MEENTLKKLTFLMEADTVTFEEIQRVVAARGYYSINTTVDRYGSDFIVCVLIGAWAQVLKSIKNQRSK
ncbi:MAG: hypothetical protein ABFD04_11675 [Syntrophomonas sp.]